MFLCTTPDCEFKSLSARDMREHLSSHSKKFHKLRHCMWVGCGKYFERGFYALFEHMQVHAAEKNLECTFTDCNYRCIQRNQLNAHIRKAHFQQEKPRQNIPCTYSTTCEYTAYDTRALEEHCDRHIGKMRWQCSLWPQCKYQTYTERALKMHIRRKHLQEKPYKCDLDGCTFEYYSRHELFEHKAKHRPVERRSMAEEPGRDAHADA